MTLPSKELLSAVLGEDITIIVGYRGTGMLNYRASRVPTHISELNIHELENMIADFILSAELVDAIDISLESKGKHSIELTGKCKNSDEYGCLLDSWFADTKLELFIKAGEWVLKEINK